MSIRNKRLSRTIPLTMAAMTAFAANSLLCRMALGQGLIDAASFTSLRVLAGAVTLGLIAAPSWRRKRPLPSWPGITALCCYMVSFSFAYVTLSTGTGALLLFGAAQLTMLISAVRGGERFAMPSWAGLGVAFLGLVFLVAPGVTAPDPLGAALMVVAGVAWGAYSLIGRASDAPLTENAGNFLYSLPPMLLLGIVFLPDLQISAAGIMLAVASGALASGLGYAIWYAALAGLSAGRAATVQLTVPVIAAIGGVAFLAEDVSFRLVAASGLTLGGIWLALSRPTGRAAEQ